MKSTGSWYAVLGDDGQEYACRIRGKLRIKDLKTTNPLAVGDRVLMNIEKAEEHTAVIDDLLPRTNYIIRQAVKKSSQAHILAANIDQAMLIVTEVYPKTSLGFIDRFLVTAESFRIPQVLVFNKLDILSPELRKNQAEKIKMYQNIGVTCLETSAITKEGIEQLQHVLDGKTTLISGHSGVGKSSLINCIAPHIEQKISEVSDFAEKGVHTTTFAEMFRLKNSTYMIDTPGIKELGLVEMDKYEISDYFPEMRELRLDCKFNNCLHLNEPGCAVKKALVNGEIAESRYKSYLSMLEGEDNRR